MDQSKRIFNLGLLALALIALSIIAGETLLSESRPVQQEIRMQALAGVQTNDSWNAVARKVGGVEMVLVPSGCFQMGSTDEQLQEAIESCKAYSGAFGCKQDFTVEQPAHRVCITQPFWIDLTPVTNRQVRSYPGVDALLATYEDPDYPRGAVTWEQAAAICAWRDARLPTEAEWEFAARGPDALLYPFGNTYDANKVSLRKISPVPVGEKPEGASWVGALDMSGGMSEWIADWYGPYPAGQEHDPAGPPSGALRIARGGSWFAHAAFFVRTTARELIPGDSATSTIGFRCVADFSP